MLFVQPEIVDSEPTPEGGCRETADQIALRIPHEQVQWRDRSRFAAFTMIDGRFIVESFELFVKLLRFFFARLVAEFDVDMMLIGTAMFRSPSLPA